MTLPVANENAITELARLAPARPPAELKMQEPGQPVPLLSVTTTAAFEPVMRPATGSGPSVPLVPTSPPAVTPTRFRR